MSEVKKEVREISKSISNSHKMAAGYQPGEYKHGSVSIDTRTCSAAQADAFITAGSKVLVKITAEEKADFKTSLKK